MAKKRCKAYLTADLMRSKIRKQVAGAIRRRHLRVQDVAKDAGMSRQTIHNFIAGRHPIGSDKLERLMKVLRLEIRPKE